MATSARKSGGVWIGWSGSKDTPAAPFLHDNIRNVAVAISRKELNGYYYGFSNRTLWPLYHDAVRPPEYHRRWWHRYREVNQGFADVAAEVAPRRALVWVHDYQLQLVPAMLRQLRSDLRIGFFLHVPFPPSELFSQLPWRQQILEGMLGADVVGFQTQLGAQNFLRLCRRYTGARGSGWQLSAGERSVQVGAFPISIDFERYDSAARRAETERRSQTLRRRLRGNRRIILGVDRLDYTKGIDIRLRAFREFLAASPKRANECVLVQTAVPSRERVRQYEDLRRRVEELVGQINGEFAEVGRAPVHYLRRNLPFEDLVAMYRAADVMLVTPLRDGMNLVAKEYVATRWDDTGVLVLSEFTGAAAELRAALLVNPHDIDGLAATIGQALSLKQSQVARRMRQLRETVRRNTVHDWANRFLGALAG